MIESNISLKSQNFTINQVGHIPVTNIYQTIPSAIFQQKFVCNRLIAKPEGFIDFPKSEIEQSIPQRFEQQVNKYPHTIAIKTNNQTLTYTQLNENANRLANTILSQRGKQPEVIVLLLEKGADFITSILGVLKTGKIFVPLDPTFPIDRLTYIIEDSQAVAFITNNLHLDLARKLANNCQLFNIDNIKDNINSNNSEKNPLIKISPETLAYIIYTSGSTGKPKGVVHSHRNSLHYCMNDTKTLLISHQDRVVFLYSCSALGGILCIFYTLLNGASLYPFNVKEQGLTNLVKWLITSEITIYHSFTTLFRHFVDILTDTEQFPKIRLVKLGGEATLIRDVENYKKYFSTNCILYASLGATEAGTFCNFIVDKNTKIANHTIPMGYPVQDMEVVILDENGLEVKNGNIGEIALKSEYLALGYWQKPELTETVFLPDIQNSKKRIYRTGDLGCIQSDGCLVHKGRKDFQVKIRGFRIEVAEIEMELLKLPHLQQAVVVATEDIPENKRLIAYIVAKKQPAPTTKEIRQHLQNKLPEYMLPSAFIFLDTLPLTPNGKLDRKGLAAFNLIKPEGTENFVNPQNDIESQLIKVWEDLLGIQPIGVQDDFFELGGNSLLAVRLFADIEHKFAKKLPLAALFPSATIAAIAQIIQQEKVLENTPKANYSSLVEIQSHGTKPPLFMIHPLGGEVLCYRNLARHLGLEQPLYGLQPQKPDQKQFPVVRVENMASQYLQEIQTLQPQGPYFLGGYSFGGIIAYEIAQQLHRQGQKVAFLAMLDTCRPGYKRRLSFLKRIYLHLNYIAQHRSNYISHKAKSFYKHTKFYIKQIFQHHLRLVTQIFNPQTPKINNYLHSHDIYTQAMNTYTFQPYSGKVTLFRTKDENRTDAIGMEYDSKFGWGEIIIGDLDVKYIPGSHLSLLDEPNVRVLAKKMKICLHKAQNLD
ncbi:amino acid adenylation domain-containing protein [Dolichospermum planctonicum CS-1226]|uniref:Amino acid adenylation domain-containing protein n=1 Tax=Dolichospermum planctonicum CS-1226 TaxID=3021751 RepID=A0ABT5AJC3_9CYAN|nr:amino acid adenylation domain-containing protein [Dolichospermum planctonicum]MDB9537413.1 amino acid adenylation domain-containing protein [Dolichospermum planctonicum CS-1226]